MNVQAAHFGAVERAGAAAAEDSQLVAGLVDRAVAVDTLRDGEGGASGASSGDELGVGRGLKPEKCAGRPKGKEFAGRAGRSSRQRRRRRRWRRPCRSSRR